MFFFLSRTEPTSTLKSSADCVVSSSTSSYLFLPHFIETVYVFFLVAFFEKKGVVNHTCVRGHD